MGIQDGLNGIFTQRRRNLILQLTMITSIVAAMAPAAAGAGTDSELQQAGSHPPPALTHCVERDERRIGRRLLYITTLDGRLSALDIAKSGKLRWSVPTGPGPLISSSIHRLELTNNGQFVRMIPSLSGGIYKFDGDSIDPIPITAEHLLSSSAKFSDDLVISGGKETRTYGVSARTGQLLYECSINGCANVTAEGRTINDTIEDLKEEPLPDDAGDDDDDQIRDEAGYIVAHDPLLDDVIVVRRQTQTVRAVESRTGMERWNFSVGQHELDMVRASECHMQPRDELELAVLDVDIKVVVPEGIICAFSKSNPHDMLWKYKFDHPIVSAWNTNADDELKAIDLFSSAQWLWDQDEEELPNSRPSSAPSIYLGMYDKQLYIQESIRLRQEIMDQTQVYQQLTGDTSLMPKIPWKPIAASSHSLVIFQANQIDPEVIGEEPPTQGSELVPYDDQNFAVAAQSVLNASEFVNGNGYYFFTGSNELESESECGTNETSTGLPAIEAPPSSSGSNTTGGADATGNHSSNDGLGFSLDDIDAPVKVVILSLWFWWKEIVVIAFTSAVILNIFMGQRNQRVEREYLVIERHVPVQTAIEATEASTRALLGPVVPMSHQHHHQQQRTGNRFSFPGSGNTQRSLSESTTHSGEHYTSRFQTDFDLMTCLGRGGFGVVFEAKNKLDENHYAVKRITLPNKESSRQRVLREARTLASCEHHNIVRYFHSWTETPPTGWQEEEDRKLLAHELSTSIQIETPDESTLPSMADQLQEKRHQQLLSWVSDAANSTACSHDFHGNGDTGGLRNIKEEYDDDDDEEEDSLIEFRSESQSAALRAGDQEQEDDYEEDDESRREGPLHGSSVSIDIHSASFDLKNINYSQHPLVSNSFQIESVRSKGNGSDDAGDSDRLRKKPLTLALAQNHNYNHQPNGSHGTPPSATMQNGVVSKPSKVYLYIQMQLCRKESLRDWLRENRTEARASHIADIFHQIVDAVDYVHLKGLIHRDLKPSNIFFSQDGKIKIGDFGLVTDMADIPNLVAKCGDQSGLPSCARHTQQVGTHLYMSPEQLLGRHYDYRVDIYSLGLIFFELHVYFCTEMERIKTLRGLREGQYPKDFANNYPGQYELLQQMLSANPDQRPQTKQLKHQLHDILRLPDHLADGRSEQAALVEAARRLSRSRTFSSSSDPQQHQ
ncbi:eukaryotic translation initiation factor 2-alpha kinase isoform X1 [Drosophila obscura]|uniref:eukaryotic translation initiation factor 2-alpha kinase isoform X1 n=1 Tax=Drosophila obscura TaxID=7282 RepID=UPI001BB126C3|nr:eukaryotic translation initiation factor 2-alpha kinase isoform X1 [Drosophila obscura]